MAARGHYLDCRKATAGAFATVVALPLNALTLRRGEPRSFTVTGMSGEVARIPAELPGFETNP